MLFSRFIALYIQFAGTVFIYKIRHFIDADDDDDYDDELFLFII